MVAIGEMSLKGRVKEFLFLPSNIWNILLIKSHRIFLGKNVKIRGKINFFGNGKLEIGNNTTINSGKIANPAGGSNTTFYIINGAHVKIGPNCGISNSTICAAMEICIGSGSIIGVNCSIYDTDFHSINYLERKTKPDKGIKMSPIHIGNDVFIGANCIILKGVTIGDRSVIAAGAVVTKNVPKDQLWGGNPAVKIKDIDYSGNFGDER